MFDSAIIVTYTFDFFLSNPAFCATSYALFRFSYKSTAVLLILDIVLAACMALSIGIAIQNFPEGSVISFPLLKKGYSKNKAFLYGFISGIFELLGTLITLIFTNFIIVVLPYMLAIAAGAMMYVIVVELIPESEDKSKLNVIGFLIGFLIMMILDVML